MALDLSLTKEQSNDGRYLVLTDATGEVLSTGWGVGGNESYGDIVGSATTTPGTYHLLLNITVLNKEGVSTTYNEINLYDFNTTGPFTIIDDLTWTIYADDLINSVTGTAMGADTDRLVDGIWQIEYKLQTADTATEVDTLTEQVLVDGDVRADVYNALREIPRQYDDEINDESKEILDTVLKWGYLFGINASSTVSQRAEIESMLWTLNKLNADGSKYSW